MHTTASVVCVLFMVVVGHANLLSCSLFPVQSPPAPRFAPVSPCSEGVAPCVWLAIVSVSVLLPRPAVAVCWLAACLLQPMQ